MMLLPLAPLLFLSTALPPAPPKPPVTMEEKELEALLWLPSQRTAQEQCDLCQQHIGTLQARRLLEREHWRELEDALQWARHCESCWTDLRLAHCENWQTSSRAACLERLRESIGETNYTLGIMPWLGWNFTKVD